MKTSNRPAIVMRETTKIIGPPTKIMKRTDPEEKNMRTIMRDKTSLVKSKKNNGGKKEKRINKEEKRIIKKFKRKKKARVKRKVRGEVREAKMLTGRTSLTREERRVGTT